jgi:hypothetical protein
LYNVGCTRNTSAPTITFGENNVAEATVDIGGSLELPITVKADAKLKEVRYFKKKIDGEEIPSKSVTKFSNPKKFESSITLRDITSDIVLVVEAVDRKNRTTTAEFVVKIGRRSASNKFSIHLGFNRLNSVGSSYSVGQGKVLLLYEAKKAQQGVDFMFFYGKKNGVTVAAPSSNVVTSVFNNASYGVQTWTNRNETRFMKVNLSYETASTSDIVSALNGGKSSNMVNHLSNSSVVAFQTASGQVGLIKISNIGPNSASTLHLSVRTI